MNNADMIKTQLIRWLLSGALSFNVKKDSIGLEVSFSKKRRKADLVVFAKEFHAFEIKSDLDKITNLEDQLFDYHNTFDRVSVVTTSKHIDKIKKIIKKNTGLILIGKKINVIRRPSKNLRLNKLSLLNFISKDKLTHFFNKNLISYSTDELRHKISENTNLNDIREYTYLNIRKKYDQLFHYFLKDTRGKFQWDELRMLSGKSSTQLYF